MWSRAVITSDELEFEILFVEEEERESKWKHMMWKSSYTRNVFIYFNAAIRFISGA